MIKVNELRIGNLAQNKLGHIIKLTYIAPNEMNGDFELFPIPLTPEILEKCGFEKSTGEYGEGLPTLGKFEASFFDGDNFVTQLVSIRYDKKIVVKIASLHQLQNLYFALTGEELEINL